MQEGSENTANSDIKGNIRQFYEDGTGNPNHRYRSWEHCYTFFQDHRPIQRADDFNMATLHLAFYLASWGMYRGSSQLLQKDYRVHETIVRELVDDKYARLWQLDVGTITPEGREIEVLFQLADRLRHLYEEVHVSPTDILVSKVMLGTLGCIPAYDNFFCEGVRYWKTLPENFGAKFPARFGKKSYVGLLKFYRRYKEDIEAAQQEIAGKGGNYPVMKLIDMYFWNLGDQKSRNTP